MEWSVIPACPSLMCSFNMGNIEGTALKKCGCVCVCVCTGAQKIIVVCGDITPYIDDILNKCVVLILCLLLMTEWLSLTFIQRLWTWAASKWTGFLCAGKQHNAAGIGTCRFCGSTGTSGLLAMGNVCSDPDCQVRCLLVHNISSCGRLPVSG